MLNSPVIKPWYYSGLQG